MAAQMAPATGVKTVRAVMDRYRADENAQELDLLNKQIVDWEAWLWNSWRESVDATQVVEAKMAYNPDIPDPNRPNRQRLEVSGCPAVTATDQDKARLRRRRGPLTSQPRRSQPMPKNGAGPDTSVLSFFCRGPGPLQVVLRFRNGDVWRLYPGAYIIKNVSTMTVVGEIGPDHRPAPLDLIRNKEPARLARVCACLCERAVREHLSTQGANVCCTHVCPHVHVYLFVRLACWPHAQAWVTLRPRGSSSSR